MIKKSIAASLLASTLVFAGCASIPNNQQQQKNLALLQSQMWVMTHIGAVEYKTDVTAHNVPSLQFSDTEMRVSGADGCNRLMGSYAIKGHKITLAQLASTQMMCMNTMELANKYNQALNQVAGYQVYNQTLKLLDQHGNVVLQFKGATQTH